MNEESRFSCDRSRRRTVRDRSGLEKLLLWWIASLLSASQDQAADELISRLIKDIGAPLSSVSDEGWVWRILFSSSTILPRCDLFPSDWTLLRPNVDTMSEPKQGHVLPVQCFASITYFLNRVQPCVSGKVFTRRNGFVQISTIDRRRLDSSDKVEKPTTIFLTHRCLKSI